MKYEENSFKAEKSRTAYNTSVARFIKLQSDGISFKSIKEALTKQFYNDIFAWYLWANDVKSNVSFPNDTNIEDDDREKLDVKIIRLITRMMFVWFIKQKKLVPNCIFDETYLTSNKYKVSKNQIMMKKFQFSWEKSMVFLQLK